MTEKLNGRLTFVIAIGTLEVVFSRRQRHSLNTIAVKPPVAAGAHQHLHLLDGPVHLVVADHTVLVGRGGGQKILLLSHLVGITIHRHAAHKLESSERLESTGKVKNSRAPFLNTPDV